MLALTPIPTIKGRQPRPALHIPVVQERIVLRLGQARVLQLLVLLVLLLVMLLLVVVPRPRLQLRLREADGAARAVVIQKRRLARRHGQVVRRGRAPRRRRAGHYAVRVVGVFEEHAWQRAGLGRGRAPNALGPGGAAAAHDVFAEFVGVFLAREGFFATRHCACHGTIGPACFAWKLVWFFSKDLGIEKGRERPKRG